MCVEAKRIPVHPNLMSQTALMSATLCPAGQEGTDCYQLQRLRGHYAYPSGARGFTAIRLKQSRFIKRNCSCGVHSSLIQSACSAASLPGRPHSLTESCVRLFCRRQCASFSFTNLQPRLPANRTETNPVLPFVVGMSGRCFRPLVALFRYDQV